MADWAESSVFATSSALLLLIASLFDEWWFLSFVALAPFLYRLTRSNAKSAARVGVLFGLAFFAVTFIDSILLSPVTALTKVLIGTATFGLFGWITGFLSCRVGFNPVLIATIWIGLEFALLRLGIKHQIFVDAKSLSLPFFNGLATLFGTAAVSFLIVLLNSLFAVTVDELSSLEKSIDMAPGGDPILSGVVTSDHHHSYILALVPEVRGPPGGSYSFNCMTLLYRISEGVVFDE